MKAKLYIGILYFGLFFSTSSWAISDIEIQKKMIQDSVAAYPRSCPCPYSKDRSGRKCGKRSAYSKPKGYAPFCYPSDIPKDVIKVWRESNPKLYK